VTFPGTKASGDGRYYIAHVTEIPDEAAHQEVEAELAAEADA